MASQRFGPYVGYVQALLTRGNVGMPKPLTDADAASDCLITGPVLFTVWCATEAEASDKADALRAAIGYGPLAAYYPSECDFGVIAWNGQGTCPTIGE